MKLFLLALVATALARTPVPNVAPGDPALVFSLPTLNPGSSRDAVIPARVGLSDYTGLRPTTAASAVVVHFFSARDAAELDALNRLQKRYGAKGAQMVAIAIDDGDLGDLSDWVAGQKLVFPVLRDAYGVVAGRYGATAPPLTFIVDGDGAVFAIGQPSAAELESEIEKELQVLIPK